jgi:hypothetical protein
MQATPHLAFYIAAGFCAAVCLFFLALFLREQANLADFRLISTEWKGLGGGLGGLRISKALTFALIAVVFGFLTTFIVTRQIDADRERAYNELQIQERRESEIRKYEDAKQAREADLEKARAAGTGTAHPGPTVSGRTAPATPGTK